MIHIFLLPPSFLSFRIFSKYSNLIEQNLFRLNFVLYVLLFGIIEGRKETKNWQSRLTDRASIFQLECPSTFNRANRLPVWMAESINSLTKHGMANRAMNNERFIRDCRSSPSPFASHLPRRGHRFHRILNGAARTRLAMIALRLLSSTGFSLEFRSAPRTWSSAVSLPPLMRF